jgi:2,3-bisphosphoglycerate-independent phosphoglycerate mutase
MNSALVTKEVVARIQKEQESLIVVNFAQPDMVGHTGNFNAAVAAVESTDICLREIATAGLDHGYNVFITADHGNIEMMKDPETGQPHTSHTTNPVPLICVGAEMKKFRLKSHGVLSDISPTILFSMGLEIPEEMTSNNLLGKNF